MATINRSKKLGKQMAARSKGRTLGKRDWISGARKLLIRRGIASVKVEPLAKLLGVTTGSFYWHFSNRQELHDELLKDWQETNTAPLFKAVANAGPDPRKEYMEFFGVWLYERDFDPRYDQAIRDWARTSKKVAKVLAKVENRRIALLMRIFQNFGYQGTNAEIRARITYYHQVGYYAMDVRENRGLRFDLAPYYAEVLTGDRWMHEMKSRDEIMCAMKGCD
jgi:AcrR family transcriptional regulator